MFGRLSGGAGGGREGGKKGGYLLALRGLALLLLVREDHVLVRLLLGPPGLFVGRLQVLGARDLRAPGRVGGKEGGVGRG